MASVRGRINEIKQPRGGYLKPSDLCVEALTDAVELNQTENIHSSIVGMTVDYLTRFMNGSKPEDVFSISLEGASRAEKMGFKGFATAAKKLLNCIKGLDDASIVSACKLTTFDVWYRNIQAAAMSKTYQETNPDKATIENIRTMVNRSLAFFKKYGPVMKNGFTFEDPYRDVSDYEKMRISKKGSFGGYTSIVDSGDGDFLTEDTLWDFKVSISEPTNKQTLQLLMYWIMGRHSGQTIFKNITKIGIFNPRLNKVYTFRIADLPTSIIEEIEKEVICY